MIGAQRVLAVIPARGGSTGLPGKNIRPLAGLPLLAHSLRLARLCPEIDHCVVSTDSPEIAELAQRHGGDAPFLRPAELARPDTPMWLVLKHALAAVEAREDRGYGYLLLLDPTSPTRLPEDVREACRRLGERPDADGIVAVSKPHYSPLWHTVVEKDGLMSDFAPDGGRFDRRQDVPDVYHINGLLYLWRARFVRTHEAWRGVGRHLMLVLPEGRAVSIDDLEQFERTEALIRGGAIKLPWLGAAGLSSDAPVPRPKDRGLGARKEP
ncbi:MAG: acylneuraminate cytidylyltransferase family protein [Elusimicrobia bacterium]|nr:acylneuraminate cytidylyltransferase family protein [Elusimicrobiota bacterium]